MCGLSREGIEHRFRTGRLHRVRRGVYAVGRPELTRHGEMMAAVLAAGVGAVLDDAAAAELLGIRPAARRLSVTVPPERKPRLPDLIVHRRRLEPWMTGTLEGIGLTSPALTLVDLAASLGTRALERAIDEADKLDLIDPETLRREVDRFAGRRGAPTLRAVLAAPTFTLTDSVLERLFLPIAERAGLPKPQTGERVNGFEVDFFWPDLGLVVETDGLRYHRTPAQQTRALRRDQAHYAAGMLPLRFSHHQVAFEGDHVQRILRDALGVRAAGSASR